MALAFEAFLTEGFLAATFLVAADLRAVLDFFLPEAFLPEAFLPEAFRDAAFPAFLLPVPFLAVVLRVDFFTTDFLVFFFLLGFRAAAFFRAGFFFDTFLAEDFVFVLLTLRFVPEVFLLAPGLREELLDEELLRLLVPARFAFLLAAFLAGMVSSCGSEKNAKLYIGCPDMEALKSGYFAAFRLEGECCESRSVEDCLDAATIVLCLQLLYTITI